MEFTKGLSCPLQNALSKLHLKNKDNHHNNNKNHSHNNNNNTKSSQPDRAEGVRIFETLMIIMIIMTLITTILIFRNRQKRAELVGTL